MKPLLLLLSLLAMLLGCPSSTTPDSGAGDAAKDARADAAADASGASCDAGESRCGSQCVDLQRAFQHCGACGRRCDGIEICLRGACVRGGTCPRTCTRHEDCRACTYENDPTVWCCAGAPGSSGRDCLVGGGTRCLTPD